MSYNREDHEVLNIPVALDVVCFRIEGRLRHAFKVVVVDCLGLAESYACQSLVCWNTDHLGSIQN